MAHATWPMWSALARTWPGRPATSRAWSPAETRSTIRLLAPAPDFLSRIALPAFCAVPSNTPIKEVREIPSAGPYYVTSYTPGQAVVLARNPNYHGSRPHHFARIELAVGISTKRAFHEIEAGSADYTRFGLVSVHHDRRARLAARRPLRARQPRGRTRNSSSTSSIRGSSSTSSF